MLSWLSRSSQQLRFVWSPALRAPRSELRDPSSRFTDLASWASLALLQISIACTACSPEQLDREGADAGVYIRAFCEDGCSKWEECAPLPSGTEDCSVEECVDQMFSDELDRPCFEPKLEYSRCRIERESCEEYFAMGIQTGPETACYDILVVAQTCIERYSDPG